MFNKELPNGKYRYYQKYYNPKISAWRQVSVTMKSKSRVSELEAKRRLALKIEKALAEPTEAEQRELDRNSKSLKVVFEEWSLVRKESIKSSSYQSEQNSLKLFLKLFGNEKIKDLSTDTIQKFLMSLPNGVETLKNKRIYLRSLFNYAVSMGYLEENPIDNVVLPKVKQSYEKIKKAKENFLTRDELYRVFNYCISHKKDIRYALAMEFIFWTGCRFAEFIGIRYCDVDFENGLLRIDHAINYTAYDYDDRVLQTPKTVGSVRTIILNDRCLEIIAYFRRYCLDDEFIFVNDKGHIMRQPVLYRFIDTNCRTVLGNHKRYGIHMLRHSHITLLVELGVPIKAIMERVGHVDESITLRVYSHVTNVVQLDIRDKLNANQKEHQKLTIADDYNRNYEEI
ncbi:tyrosine-type recombinase/integrase [Streptococcus equinus]|uniref:tyrosine-type recombinase/integrase n=1 Tax=Streptococcus equinus TaxID=1335 RepID=UPI0009B83D87|nr:site-specific integrase [Streptococcus equinus]